MASKTVSQLKIKLGLENSQVFDKLRGSFRQLEKTVGVTDKGLEELRKGIKAYSNEGNNSIKVLKGQIESLKDLKEQASVGGRTFKRLADDIKLYERQLKSVEQQANSTAKALSARKIETGFEKLGVAGLQQQLAKRQKFLGQQDPLTEQYAAALGDVLQFEAALARLQERQAVIAAQARTVTFTPARGGQGIFDLEGLSEYAGVFRELPNTTAGFGQRLKELRQDFVNLDIGSDKYLSTLREIAAVQRQIARSERIQELAGRDEGLLGRQGTLEAYLERGRGRRTRLTSRLGAAAQDARDRAAAAQRAAAPVPTQVREISGLYQQIGDIGMARTRGYIDAMGNSYRQVTQDIKAATVASNGSINSLQSQRGAWVTLRNNLRPTTRAYKEVTREIKNVDRQLARLEGRSKFSPRALTQIAGATLSGGIFGGPLGALGGLVGGGIGGVGGAYAGAAVGAQLNVVTDVAKSMATYSAELNLAKQTLAQVVNTQREYNVLLDNARKISTDYSVSFKDTITGYAQVAVAARANNLTLEQTETIYRGIVASGTAFGKSQEDIAALVRATVQVLSKGKVSAEELSGQIGERLPGAVAKFAQANNMSLDQLTSAFKKGEVTIEQFVQFTEAQLNEYDGLAKIIGEGPEKAGARLEIALNRVSETYGIAFQRIGAGIQDNITKVLAWVNKNEEQLKILLTGFVNFARDLKDLFVTLGKTLVTAFGPFFKWLAENIVRGVKGLNQAIELASTPAAIRTEAKGMVDALGYGPLESGKKQQAYQEAIKTLNRYYARKKTETPLTVDDLFKPFEPKFGTGAGGGATGGGELGGDGDSKKLKDISREQAVLLNRINNLRRQGFDIQADILEFERALLETKEMAETPEKASVARSEALEKFTKARAQWFKGMTADIIKGGKALAEQEKLNKQFNFDLKERQYQLGLIGEKEYNSMLIERERARLKEAYPDLDPAQREEMVALKQQEIDPTPFQEMKQNIAQLKQELTELLNPVNQITGAAGAIGQAFSTSFINVINGSQTAQEALAGFFRNIGNYFLDMAGQIIAKMITMAILNTVVGLLPGGAAPSTKTNSIQSGSDFGLKGNIISMGGPDFAAKGAYFAGGVAKFAMGGIVNRPTMFAYANGGTGRFGLMGEAGPEAIMPLKRGPDGKLGVAGGGGVSVGQINITVENKGEQLSPAAQKQIANQVQGIVLANLVNERRSGGILR
jgi:tape measure domain-containing protein